MKQFQGDGLLRLLLVMMPALFGYNCMSQQAVVQKSVFNHHIELLLPQGFSLMDSEMVDFKFSGSNYKPSDVWSDASTDITISIQQQPEWLDSSQLDNFRYRQVDLLKKSMPNAEWLEQGSKKIKGRTFGYFRILTNTYRQESYQYFFFTTLNNHPLIICIGCTGSRYSKWKKTEPLVVNSITIHE